MMISSCATQKKRSELSWLAKRYHNMTAQYNGYYNADIILNETLVAMNEGHEDNFNQILPVYPYSSMESPEVIKLELDRAIEKATKVSRLHESSKWVDDCYVLMGKAQYLQGNFEAAEETFEYFINNFNPKDPKSRLYSEKEVSSKTKAKQRQKKAKEVRKKKLEERKQKEKERNKEIKDRKKEENQEKKDRNQKKKDREIKKTNQDKDKADTDAREQKIKERKEAIKNSAKKEKKKELSAEELRKQKIKDRNEKIKNRKKESNKKKKKPKITREERDAAKKAKEEKKAADREASENKRKSEKLERQNKREEEKLAKERADQQKKEVEAKKKEIEEEESRKKEEALSEKNAKKSKKNNDDTLEDRAKGGFLKHQPAYYEGMLWLAKTYISRENFVQAKYYINRIEEEVDKGVPAHVINELPVVRSDLFIRQKNYEDAIDPLRQAIESTKNKGLKARYAFILAQIHQKNGNTQAAADAFAQVEKFSKNYNMNLNARLNQVKNEWASGRAQYDRTIKKLNRMERDKKNAGFEGAIYFTRAEVKLANGNNSGAVEDFEKALAASVNNTNTIESYYRLASLYYGLEDYLKAKSYFDSTATTMQKRDNRYEEVQRKKTNLKEIAKNITIISDQDSLLKMGQMSKEELQQYALNIIEAKEKDAEEANRIKNSTPPPATTSGGTSKFFAYNTRSISKGKNSFNSRWGGRILEDDWRRSNKQSSTIENIEDVQTLAELDGDRKKDVDKILRVIPKNKKEREKVIDKLEQAFFDLGIGYRNYIKNYKSSSKTLSTYVTRFPNAKNLPDAYYYLYLNAQDLSRNAEEQKYYDILINNYPESDYAKVLKNPAYAKELLTEEKKISKAYNSAYELFEKADFQSAFDALKKAKSDYGKDHHLVSKYDLLEAMCIGNIKGKNDYISALRKVVIKHSNTPEQTRAREMLRFLKGDGDAFEGEITSEDIQDFSQEDDKLHYIVVALFEADGNIVNQAKNSINKYNQANHKDKRIRSTSIYLNQKKRTHLILLRRFENKEVSMSYFTAITKDVEQFLDPGIFSYDLFSVNQKNYREIVKQKSTRSYRLFFDTYYLDGDK